MADFKVTALSDDTDFDNLAWWDVVIIGAGPGGLAASLTTAHRALTTLVIEAKDQAGGQPNFLYSDKLIVDIPGFPDGITGHELSERTYQQAVNALVQFHFNEELLDIEETDEIEGGEPLKRVITSKGCYLCRKVILACGLLHYPRKLPVLDSLESSNVHYRIPKVEEFGGREVVVIGGGDSALDAAVIALQRHAEVDLIARGNLVGKADTARRIEELGGRIQTEAEVTTAEIANDILRLTVNGERTIDASTVIVQIGFLSARETFERLGVVMNSDGSIAIDPYFETSRKGVFAVGDVHGDIKLIAVAWAEGIQAAIHAFKEITSPYWLNEKRLRDQKITLIGQKIAAAASREKPKR